jgi:bacterioferritin
VNALNADLAAEYAAIIQYLTYAAQVHGPFRPQLRQFFLAEIPDETRHAQFLADKISAMGGVPVTTPAPVPQATTARGMLEAVFEAESQAVERYIERAKQAEAAGEKGLQVQLEDMVRDETQHREETARILEDWRG